MLFVCFRHWLLKAKRLIKEASEPVHGELIHFVEKFQVLNRKVEPCTLLRRDLELLSLLSNLVFIVFGLFQLLLDFVRGLL